MNKIKINKNRIFEEMQQIINAPINTANKVQEKAIQHLPVEMTQDLQDEKELVHGMGGPSRYIAHNKAMYKMLGGISGLSLGAKVGLLAEPHELFNIQDNPDSIVDPGDLIGYGLTGIGAIGGGYLGSRLGNKYGEYLSNKTLESLGIKTK